MEGFKLIGSPKSISKAGNFISMQEAVIEIPSASAPVHCYDGFTKLPRYSEAVLCVLNRLNNMSFINLIIFPAYCKI